MEKFHEQVNQKQNMKVSNRKIYVERKKNMMTAIDNIFFFVHSSIMIIMERKLLIDKLS